jgi:DNA-binding winged helix-turn-helix (wHTH) protein
MRSTGICALSKREEVCVPELVIDEARRSVFRDGQEVQLSPQEYRVLHYLGQHAGQVVPKSQLAAVLWGEMAHNPAIEDALAPTALDLVIFRLRQKLLDRAQQPTFVETRRGFGYLLHRTRLVGRHRCSSDATNAKEHREANLRNQTETPALEETFKPWAKLTRREWELFLLLGDEQTIGLTNRGLAAHLQIAESTLKKHLQQLYRKLGVTNRAGAVLLALQAKQGS